MNALLCIPNTLLCSPNTLLCSQYLDNCYHNHTAQQVRKMTVTTTLAASSAVGTAVTATTKAFKVLAGSVLILGLANVVRFAGLREVPALQPKFHKEVKAMSIGQCLAGCACVITVCSTTHGCKAPESSSHASCWCWM
jgi:hypothetical protein